MKQAGGETLYLKVDRNVQVHDKKVTIGDLASFSVSREEAVTCICKIIIGFYRNAKTHKTCFDILADCKRITKAIYTDLMSIFY